MLYSVHELQRAEADVGNFWKSENGFWKTTQQTKKALKKYPLHFKKLLNQFVIKIMTQEVFCGKNILYIFFYTFNTYKNIQTQKIK